MDAQQTVAAGLLDEGVRVVFDAKTPYADLRNRVMHLRPLPEQVADDDLLHLRADCDHEMGHFGATDPDVVEGISRPLAKLIANCIEDGFVERWVSEKWLGCAQNLYESNRAILAEIYAARSTALENVRARAVSALQTIAFGKDRASVRKLLGDDIDPILDQLGDLIDELPKVNNSAMSVALAHKIADRWRWGEEDAKKKKKQQHEEGDKEQKKRREDVSADDERRREDKVAAKLDDETLGRRRKRKIAALSFPAATSYRPYTDEDVVSVIEPMAGPDVDDFLQEVRSTAAPLRRRLLMEFRSVASAPAPACDTGELDRSALHRVAFGRRDIFEEEEPQIVVDADVTMLIDVSGSMAFSTSGGQTRMQLAAKAAAAFAMSLDLLGIPNESLAFTTCWHYGRANGLIHRAYQRVRPLHHIIVKGADEPFRSTRARFAALAKFDDAVENIDGESVLWAASRLAARGRPGITPVMLVFSDGEPASEPEDMGVLSQHLASTVARVKRAGIKVIGVGIGSSAVSRYYDDHIVVSRLDELVRVTYLLLKRIGRTYSRAC